MKIKLILSMLAGVCLLIISACTSKGSADSEKPNLVFVFTDQQSFDMLGCYGNEQIITPNIDAFAEEGVRFNHCISNTPVCSPYRGMLFSGLHPLYNGVIANDIQMLPGEGNYFGEVLSDAGYYTGYFGKWHLYGGDRVRPIPPGPYRYGFDDEFLSNNCTMLYDSARAYFWNEAGEKELYGDWEYNVQSRQAVDFIDRNADKPIAMFLSWHAPHDWMAGGVREHKYSAPREFEALYDTSQIQLRGNVTDTERHRLYYQGHMAMITSLDRDFGLILDKLEEKGIAENSIIVFTSDHGDMLESHDWPFNKGRPEIESIRVPLIIKWGDRFKGEVSDLLVGTLDLMPTFLGLMGLQVPGTCHGTDLSVPIINGQEDFVESVPLFYFAGDWRGVYTHDYTYAFDLPEGQAEPHALRRGFPDYNVLYDHKADPFELNNLFDDPAFESTRQQLHERSLVWMDKFNDRGIPYNVLLPKVMVEEDYVIYQKPHREKGVLFETRLKGPPVAFQ
jgi:arylsulfatase A-like enzyme